MPGRPAKPGPMSRKLRIGGHVDRYDYHVVGSNEEFLGYFLNVSGYVNIQRVRGICLFDDANATMFKEVPVGLNMVAEKSRVPPAGTRC